MTPAALWCAAALALGLAELAIPGVFLIFLAIAAGVTGALAFVFPGLPVPGQLATFAGWAVVTVLTGRRLYGEPRGEASDPLLNRRAARLVGTTARVVEPVDASAGRVALGDGVWLARGGVAAVGATVRVVEVDGAVLVVEPVASSG